MIALIDHYDSFIDMLADYVRRLGFQTIIIKTDELDKLQKYENQITHYIFGPGPGHPHDAVLQNALSLLKSIEGKKPILGVCLGHQLIAYLHGARVIKAGQIMHGKLSKIYCEPDVLFENIPQAFHVTRYHSFLVDPVTLSTNYKVLALTQAHEIMAFRHQYELIWGVQFHPEAVKTQYGLRLLQNFLKASGVAL